MARTSSIGGKTRKVEYLTSGTTWTRPPDVDFIEEVIIQAGGASGAYSAAGAGGAGAGSAIVLKDHPVSGNITYAIAAGGAAQTGGGGGDGNDGGNTSWDGITANGGKKGLVSNQTGGAGGIPVNITTAPAGGAGTTTGAAGANATGSYGPYREEYTGAAGGGGRSDAVAGGKGGNSANGFEGGAGVLAGGDDGFGGGGASLLSKGGAADSQTAVGYGAGSGGANSTGSVKGGDGIIKLVYRSAY